MDGPKQKIFAQFFHFLLVPAWQTFPCFWVSGRINVRKGKRKLVWGSKIQSFIFWKVALKSENAAVYETI